MTTWMVTLRVNWQTMKTVQKSDEETLNEEGDQNVIWRAPTETPVNGNKKLVVSPHRTRNVRSQNRVLSKIAKGMEDLAGA